MVHSLASAKGFVSFPCGALRLSKCLLVDRLATLDRNWNILSRRLRHQRRRSVRCKNYKSSGKITYYQYICATQELNDYCLPCDMWWMGTEASSLLAARPGIIYSLFKENKTKRRHKIQSIIMRLLSPCWVLHWGLFSLFSSGIVICVHILASETSFLVLISGKRAAVPLCGHLGCMGINDQNHFQDFKTAKIIQIDPELISGSVQDSLSYFLCGHAITVWSA